MPESPKQHELQIAGPLLDSQGNLNQVGCAEEHYARW